MTLRLLSLVSLFAVSSGVALAKEKGAKPGDEGAKIPVVYSSKYKISLMGLENLHPFDIGKYDKIYKRLKKEGWVNKDSVSAPEAVTDAELLMIHSQAYLDSLKVSANVASYLEAPILRKIPKGMMKRNVVDRFKLSSGGTIKAARLALKGGFAINLGGGYHHAKPNTGEGFCIIADVPIAIKVLQKEGLIKRALIIDTDVHQGNGTIVCLPNDPSTFTFSMHQEGIYPMPKEKGDLDIELKAGMQDKEYLAVLRKQLPKLFKLSKPDIVFHVAGCDALAGDPLASLQMSHEGIAQRDKMIAEACLKHNVPYVMTLSGGYSKGAWESQFKGITEVMKVAKSKR